MLEFLTRLLDVADFPPRWQCGQWTSFHGWLHIVSDVLVFLAYTAIPIVLAYFVRRRPDVPFPKVFWLFCLFIFSCGTVHLIESTIFWWPVYRVSAVAKVVTAAASWATVGALVLVTPRALALPGLASVNAALEREIAEHRRSVTALRESEQRLQDREARLRALLETLADGVITIDSQGVIRFVNPAAQRLFGHDRESMVGANVNMLMPSPDREQHDDYLRRYRETGQAHIIGIGREVVGQRADGSTFPMHLSIGEFESDGQTFFTGVVQDITEQKRLEVGLRRANASLRARHDEMHEICSIIAHDLRHPVVSVQGLLGLLKQDCYEQLDQDSRDNVDLCISECERMKRLLREVSQIARIDRAEPERDTVHVELFIRSCAERFRPRLQELGVEVEVSAPDEERTFAVIQVEEALVNLIDNALKYACGPEGGRIEIRARFENVLGQITVADHGPGIDPAYHDRVFQLFRRLSPEGGIEGTGVGLAAVRRLMQRIGGEVHLDSEPGQGRASR